MQQHLVEHGSEHVPVARVGYCRLHCFGNGAAKASGSVRILFEKLASHIGGHTWRWGHLCAIGSHHLATERFLLIGTLHHKHLAVKAEICTGHTHCRAPLTCPGLGGDTLQPLLFGIIGLSDG